MAVFSPPAGESDGPLIAPPVIESVNGVLKAYVDVIRAGDQSGASRSILYGGKPTWSTPKPPPDIPPPNPGPSPRFPLNFAAAYQFTTADGRVYPAQYPGPTLHVQPGDTLDLTIHNSLGEPALAFPVDPKFFVTNLHTHGLLVEAIGNSIWTVGGFQRNTTFNLGVTDSNGKTPWSATILSYDGREAGKVVWPPRPAI